MTERSWFWGGTAVGDAALPAPYGAPYSDDMFTDVLSMILNRDRRYDAVIYTANPAYSGNLAVTNPSGNTIRVASGIALIDGKLYTNTANVDFTTAGVVGTYYVVLQKDWVAQTVRLALISSAPTQTDGTLWELALAQISVSAGPVHVLYDMREFSVGYPVERYGADPSLWGAGNTKYNARSTKTSVGKAVWTGGAAASGDVTVPFTAASAAGPFIVVTPDYDSGYVVTNVTIAEGSGFTIYWKDIDGTTHTALTFNWIGIGKLP